MNIKAILKSSLQEASGINNPHLEFSSRPEFGDYTTNVALQSKNPREEAAKILDILNKDKSLKDVVEKIDIAGPGFINFHLSTKVLSNNLCQILDQKDNYGNSEKGKGKTVVIDYSAPNIAKRFGIGHLRSTIIGQAIYNIYKNLGYKVIGDNHLGDWGTQFGVLIYMVEKNKLKADHLSVEDWEKLYVDFHKELENNPDLKDEARNAFKRLEEGDKEAKSIWQKAYDTSLKEYDKIYSLLGVNIDFAYGESFYQDKMPEVIEKLKQKSLSKVGERGAVIFEFKGMPPAMIVKSDGTTTYFTRDLATIKFRIGKWNPDLFIYEVGSDQILHFKQLFEAVKILGWAKDKNFVHVAHGLYRFKDGKMSTRRGKTINLEEVLSEAIKKAEKFNKDTAKEVGVGAIKYFDLMHDPSSDIIFEWDKIMNLQGNSGPYIQYTYARAQSVLDKTKPANKAFSDSNFISEELSVLRLLTQFPEVVEYAADTFSPNILCEYLYNLASSYNTFYNKIRIIGSENEDFRVALTKGVGQVIKNGLTLLGIAAPEKM